ncbi:MAG: SDR family oxidoreductase [Pirellulaceae bacterium]
MKNKKKSTLIFGCGYLGNRVATRLAQQNGETFAVTRSAEKATRLAAAGIVPILADWNERSTLSSLPSTEQVLVAVGWDRGGDRSQYDVYVRGLRNALDAIPRSANVVYVSSTGVYHQTDGSWVDETSPCNPPIESGGWCHLQAEALLWRHRPHAATTILRMAGLYGPDRVPRGRDIAAGQPVVAPTQGYLNLIHIDDAATAVLAAWRDNSSGHRTYVVSDGHPVVRQTYYEEIARIMRRPMPEFIEPDSSSRSKRRSTTNKRIWTARFRRELCPRLKYPDYRVGLRGILAGQW